MKGASRFMTQSTTLTRYDSCRAELLDQIYLEAAILFILACLANLEENFFFCFLRYIILEKLYLNLFMYHVKGLTMCVCVPLEKNRLVNCCQGVTALTAPLSSRSMQFYPF